MSTANDEFQDLMPHRIKVTGAGTTYDDYGKPIPGAGDRIYMCLIDDTTTTVRNAAGVEVTVALTAYVAPVPIDSIDGEPVDIEYGEPVEILSPRPGNPDTKSIERHYDSDMGVGQLHNIVLRF